MSVCSKYRDHILTLRTCYLFPKHVVVAVWHRGVSLFARKHFIVKSKYFSFFKLTGFPYVANLTHPLLSADTSCMQMVFHNCLCSCFVHFEVFKCNNLVI